MKMIQGITVELSVRKKIGEDAFKKPIYEEIFEKVENVLIAPVTSDDIVNHLDLDGKKAVYTLAIPKGDAHIWENEKVKFFGETWKICNIPLEGIDYLIPLSWNKKVMVERYE